MVDFLYVLFPVSWLRVNVLKDIGLLWSWLISKNTIFVTQASWSNPLQAFNGIYCMYDSCTCVFDLCTRLWDPWDGEDTWHRTRTDSVLSWSHSHWLLLLSGQCYHSEGTDLPLCSRPLPLQDPRYLHMHKHINAYTINIHVVCVLWPPKPTDTLFQTK